MIDENIIEFLKDKCVKVNSKQEAFTVFKDIFTYLDVKEATYKPTNANCYVGFRDSWNGLVLRTYNKHWCKTKFNGYIEFSEYEKIKKDIICTA